MAGMVPRSISEGELDMYDHIALHGTMLFSERKPSREELLKAVKALVQDDKYRREIVAQQMAEINALEAAQV